MNKDPSQQSHNYFSLFGLAITADLALDELEAAYIKLIAQHHPDRYINASDEVKQKVAANTEMINQAYAILRDEVRRYEYILELNGIKVTDFADPLPQEFLLEAMELQDELTDAIENNNENLKKELYSQTKSAYNKLLNQIKSDINAQKYGQAALNFKKLSFLRRILIFS